MELSKKDQPEIFYQNALEQMTFLYEKDGLQMFHHLYGFLFNAIIEGGGVNGNDGKNPHSLFFCSNGRGQEEERKLAILLSTVLAVCFVGETALSLPSITGVSIHENDFLFRTGEKEPWNSCVSLKDMELYIQDHKTLFSPEEQKALMRCGEVFEAMRGEIYNLDIRDHKEMVWETYRKYSPRYPSRQHPWLAIFYQEYVLAEDVFSFFEKEVYRLNTQESFLSKKEPSKRMM